MYRRLPKLELGTGHDDLPSLSIIVPARNEAENLRRLLPSLNNQVYRGRLEIIVVDDNSTDETAAIADSCGARVVSAPPLPPGWLGKPHACHSGAAAAQGEWLLFTDADTSHAPFSAATAVSHAIFHQLDGLSIFLQQVTSGWLDRAVLMVALAGLFAGMRRSSPTLNGQYLLIRRDAYFNSGGFAAVRGEMLEDLAFGRRLADQSYFVPIMRGESLARVYMYNNWGQMWRGVMRLGAGSFRWAGLGSLLAVTLVTGAMMPIWVLLFRPKQLDDRPGFWWIWGTGIGAFIPWARRLGAGWQALLAPIGAVFVQLSAVSGLLFRLLGRGISWKNRLVS
jgi:chlorobactene glucosyltransferase